MLPCCQRFFLKCGGPANGFQLTRPQDSQLRAALDTVDLVPGEHSLPITHLSEWGALLAYHSCTGEDSLAI